MAGSHGHSVDEYLEVIYFLAFPIGEYRPAGESAIASRVADMLGVSRASAGEMLKRLEAEGLVERGEQKEAILTPVGIERAERVVRKHRIIERFLTDFMGYTASESHVYADDMGDTFTDEMIDRIYERLHWGGALIMFEKVRAPDARFQDYATQIYTDYRLSRGYDENDRTQFDPGVAAALAAVVDA